jgi:hypothetical protein
VSLTPIKPFFETIYQVRSAEELVLYGRSPVIDTDDEQDVLDFLHGEWDNECLEYPGTPPPFAPQAALYGARTLFFAAQLLLYRRQSATEAAALLPPYIGPIDVSAALSADLCLRFLPAIVRQLEEIDADDALIPLLRQHLSDWPYSAAGFFTEEPAPDPTPLLEDPCARQLFADRVLERRDKLLTTHPLLAPLIRANTGAASDLF